MKLVQIFYKTFNISISKFTALNRKNFRHFAMEFENEQWRGVPITEIYGAQSPWGSPEFPLVVPSYNHTVLYHIPNNGNLAGDSPPKPQIGHDKWDQEHLRMPCSSHSLYPVEDESGGTRLKKRWEIIQDALKKPIRNSKELSEAILSYNTKFKNIWKFRALHKLFNEYLEEEESQYFFDVTLPEIAKLALSIKTLIQAPIPLLTQHKNKSISMSQQQAASLLANAFFCTFPRRNTTKRDSEYASYPHINFNSLYNTSGSDDVLEKLKCLCHYFRRVCTKGDDISATGCLASTVPVGVVTYSRRSVPPKKCPDWANSRTPISSLPVHVDPFTYIENASGLIQVDFANKYLGGGVLGHGCVQEEIRFVICPELMVSMLFNEVLRPNEAVMMIGCEQYSAYSGYGHTFSFVSDYVDGAPADGSARRRVSVLAVDAQPAAAPHLQYSPATLTRDLNKAWVGVSFYIEDTSTLNYPGLATGNWGCGAFGGTPQLKSLLQIMACAEARRPMAYYTFKDVELRDEIVNMYNLLSRHNVTVGQLYKYIVRFSKTDVRKSQLHSFIHQVLRDEEISRLPDRSKIQEDVMETSNSSLEKNDCSISEALQKHNDSPDLFSQDDTECDLKEIIIEPLKKYEKTGPSNSEDDKMAATNKMAAENRVTSNHTSRLFSEMQKFDDVNGKLNLSISNNLPEKDNSNNDLDVTMECESKIKSDYSPDVKKRMTKKITDYFAKKPF